MPRLVGKQSNSSAYAVLLLLIGIGTASALEYTGMIDVIPAFGKNSTHQIQGIGKGD
jgi:hypothetical protein